MPMPHWTDHAVGRPIFSTVIDASGSANVYAVLGRACYLLREIGVPRDRVTDLELAVRSAESYDAAIELIERWFKVRRDE